jgi:uncharacterized protein involved in exopolysaccharide biosynthesis
MFDDETMHKDRRKQSLLSHGATAAGPAAPGRVGTVLSAGEAEEVDPVTRHRIARSRREAEPSPLLSALAAMEGFRAEPASVAAAASAPEPRKQRWSLRNLLSPKLKFERPEPRPEVDEGARPDPAATPPNDGLGPQRTAAGPAAPSSFARPARWSDVPADEARGEDVPAETGEAEGDARWRPLVDPMKVISGVSNSKGLIAAMTVLGGLVGAAVALSTPHKYEAATELLVDPRDLKVSDRDLTETGLTSDALLALVENQVRVITSGTVLNKVVDKLKLDEDPEFNGEGNQGGVGNVIASLRALLSGKKPVGIDGLRRRAIAVDSLAESLSVERGGKTFVVTVSARTQNPEKSALIANTVGDVFVQTTGQLQSETAGKAADELNARLAELRNGVEQAERAAEKFRAEHDLVDAQGRLISEDELVKLNDQLSTARARTIELNARAATARAVKVDSVIGGGLPEELTSPVMAELRAQYAAIKQQADQLSVRLGPRHPQYLAMQAQLDGAREQIANELKRLVASTQTDLRRAVQQEQDLAARLAQLKVRSGDVNGDMITLRELEREVAAKRAVYENFLVRAKEAGEQRDINTANISVISQAYPPLDPSGPSRAAISLAGAALGFMSGVGLGIGRGVLWGLRDRKRVRRRSRSQAGPAADAARLSAAPADRSAAGPPDGAVSAGGDVLSLEEASNPLVRLVQRIRWPARTMSLDEGKPTVAASAANADVVSNPEPETEAPASEGRASQEAPQMYPYPPQSPAYPQHPSASGSNQPQPAHPQAYAPAQAYMPQQPLPPYPPAFVQPQLYGPYAVGYPYAPPAQPAFHGWQPQPMAMSPYGYPQPATSYPAYPHAAPQPAPYPQEVRQEPWPASQPAAEVRPAASTPRDLTPLEEVRESLREFREAIRDLTEERARRKYS